MAWGCNLPSENTRAGRSGTMQLFKLGCYQEALSHTLTLIATAPTNTREHSLLLNDAAVINEKLGHYAEAADYYAQALPLLRDGQDVALTATVAGNLATLQYRIGEYAKALASYQETLRLLEGTASAAPAALSSAHSGLGLVAQTLGQYELAHSHLNKALGIDELRLGANHADVATDLSNLGDLYRTQGNFDRALSTYQRALEIRWQVLPNPHADTANSLSKLAYTLEGLGQYDKALDLYRQAQTIREKVLPAKHPFIASTLSSIGNVLRKSGRYDEASPYFEQALVIRREVLPAGHADIADTLHNLAWLQQLANDLPMAEQNYRDALSIRTTVLGTLHAKTADTLARLASVIAARGRESEALTLQQRAYAIARATGVPEVEFRTGGLLASRYYAAGQTEQAVFIGKLAVDAMQRVRGMARSLDTSLQNGLLQENSGTYRELASRLLDLGRLAEAQQVLAMLKEDEYFEFIQRSADADPRTTQIGYSGRELEWAKRYAEIGDHLASLGREAETLRKSRRRSPEDETRLTLLETDIETASKAFDAAIDKIAAAFADTRTKDQLRKGIAAQSSAFKSTLKALGQQSGNAAALVQYIVLPDKLHILLTTPQIVIARETAISEKALNHQVAAYRATLSNPRQNPQPQAETLYRLLIGPIAEDLRQAGTHTLMLSLDGMLRYLPFAALYDGHKYLAQTLALAIYTEAARDKLLVRPKPEWEIWGLGLTQAKAGFSPLPGVKEELEGIVGNQGIAGDIRLDELFSEASLKEGLDKEYPILHIASHFKFEPGNEHDSFLLLGDGHQASLSDIRHKFDFGNIELLTLSACETAMGGGRDAKGVEVEGLGVVAQNNGAKGVMATLWKVSDVGTGKLMQSFYSLRESQKLTKAEALRQAQLTLITGSNGKLRNAGDDVRGMSLPGATSADATFTYDPKLPYAHPYYWAPFVLMGNWL